MNYKNIKHFPSNKHVYLTKKGLDRLKSRLNRLRKERFEMCKRLIKMDQKDKVDYIFSTDAIKMLEMNEEEVTKIADILQHADTVAVDEKHANVELGSTVNLKFGDQTVRYTLVDSIEANPSAHKISEESPLGKALLGKKRRAVIRVATPRGREFRYKVLAIS